MIFVYIQEIYTNQTWINIILKMKSEMIYILFFLFFMFLLRYWSNNYLEDDQKEGFIQKESFVLKLDQEVYDTFYTSVYDEIFIPLPRVEKIIQLLQKTEPYKESSTFLDIGSRTGMLVNALSKQGYNAVGIDKSESMIQYAEAKYALIPFIEGDPMIPMQFEPNTFTHICCVEFTIYQFLDKSELFRNIHTWLTVGGYLFLHLVDLETFDTVIPCGKPYLLEDITPYLPIHKQKRNLVDGIVGLETLVEFDDYHYKSKYMIRNTKWKWIETFTDKKTKHVRQHERTLFMDTAKSIISLVERHGFKKIDLFSQSEYYVFKKI